MIFLEKELKFKENTDTWERRRWKMGGSHTDMCGRDIGEGESWCS